MEIQESIFRKLAELKGEGNELYRDLKFTEALEKYVEGVNYLNASSENLRSVSISKYEEWEAIFRLNCASAQWKIAKNIQGALSLRESFGCCIDINPDAVMQSVTELESSSESVEAFIMYLKNCKENCEKVIRECDGSISAGSYTKAVYRHASIQLLLYNDPATALQEVDAAINRIRTGRFNRANTNEEDTTAAHAVEIELLKQQRSKCIAALYIRGHGHELSQKYGVLPKTITVLRELQLRTEFKSSAESSTSIPFYDQNSEGKRPAITSKVKGTQDGQTPGISKITGPTKSKGTTWLENLSNTENNAPIKTKSSASKKSGSGGKRKKAAVQNAAVTFKSLAMSFANKRSTSAVSGLQTVVNKIISDASKVI